MSRQEKLIYAFCLAVFVVWIVVIAMILPKPDWQPSPPVQSDGLGMEDIIWVF